MSQLRLVLLTGIILTTVACARVEQKDAQQRRQDSDSVAFRTGEAARRLADEAARDAKVAARKIKEGTTRAREGWKEQEMKDRDKKSSNQP